MRARRKSRSGSGTKRYYTESKVAELLGVPWQKVLSAIQEEYPYRGIIMDARRENFLFDAVIIDYYRNSGRFEPMRLGDG